MKMNILIRADSSSSIGTGHIMRDLVFAQKYDKKGHHVIFATQDLQGNINHKVVEAGYKLNILKSNDIKEVNTLIKKLEIDMIVIDNYDIDYKYEKKLKVKNMKVKILSFDDTYEKHYCDILLNHNICADSNRYKELVPSHCGIKCGKKYTLLRDEFLIEKKKLKKNIKKKTDRVKTIFVAMGGADYSNINIKILKVLKKFKNNFDIKINLVTTNANKNLKQLEKYCKSKKWINLHINSNKIAKLMRKSDFVIVTPSVTINEVYYMKIPFISIKVAENQLYMHEYLKNNNFRTMSKFNKSKLNTYVVNILEKV